MSQTSKVAVSPSPEMGRFATKLAQAAGSLSTLALLPSGAQAVIVYTPPDATGLPLSIGFSGPSEVTWDIDGNGTVDYRLFRSVSPPSVSQPGTYLGLGSIGLGGWGLVQQSYIASRELGVPIPTPNQFFNRLLAGFVVGPNMPSYLLNPYALDNRTLLHRFTNLTSTTGGNKNTVTVTHAHKNAIGFSSEGNAANNTGYIGFAFSNDEGVNLFYGWAELTLDTVNGVASINRWAYENCANQSIAVGETSGGVAAESCPVLPEPDSLALLGLGLGGLRAFRKRTRAAAR